MNNAKEYGLFLQYSREKLGLTLEQVSAKTKLAMKYLRALESMEKNIFPSEAYHVGMLKVYAQFLHIDVNEILSLLKVNEIQEQPVEFDLINLQEQKKKRTRRTIIIILAFLVLIVGGISSFFLFNSDINVFQSFGREGTTSQETSTASLERIERFYESNFDLNQQMLLVSNNAEARLTIKSINPSVISIGDQEIPLSVNNPIPIDLNGDAAPDYIVLMRSFNVSRNQLLLRFNPRVASTNFENISVSQVDEIVSDGEVKDITTAFSPQPIQIALDFKYFSYYKIVSKGSTVKEGKIEKGKEFITLDSPLTLYISNDKFVDLSINNNEVDLSPQGLPVVLYIRWVQISGGRYTLQAVPLP